ncbi:MAG: DivIVA domain-containing protein [Rhodothermales bacterium]|jgi:DivIVA domain-containing protein
MKLTALQIRKHEFGRAFRGYDTEEVNAFLSMVSQHWQSQSEDMRRLEERLEEQNQRVAHYLKVEEALEHALENARSASEAKLAKADAQAEERVLNADSEAEEAVRTAETRANDLLGEAKSRAAETIENAESHAANAVKRAAERADATIAEAEQRLQELVSAADAARAAARQELGQLESERQRVLTGLGDLLRSSLSSMQAYDAAEEPEEVTAFQAVVGVAFAAPLDREEVEPWQSAAQPDGDADGNETDPEEAMALVDLNADSAPDADGHIGAEAQTGADEDAVDEAVDETQAKPGPEHAGIRLISSSEAVFEGLPSADDGFEEEGGTSGKRGGLASTSDPQSKTKKFGADEEIKKIRRILEDLDS